MAAWRLTVHEELASTQDVVLAAAAAGEPEGLAVLARRQTAGRGTQGRPWHSTAGNLHLSFLWRPAGPARELPQWGLLVAVALAETVAELLPPDAELALKWPNDLLLGGAKCAGILTEAAPDGQGGIGWIIPGIGVNLREAPPLPDRPTASLAGAGIAPPEPAAFAERFLAALGRWRQQQQAAGFAPMREAWMRFGPALGTPLWVRQRHKMLSGRFAGLAEDGRLMLEVEGVRIPVAAGELASMPPLATRAGNNAPAAETPRRGRAEGPASGA
ncbi:biotin--[acetyl-CoA-carboxylase] ligase [Roseomonas sp. E05]|uniref:biotin--[acetyl-CoA-carboxylase] ligase n=1 Tax=Roseomonas sp. E05 TaxID=3046310 RepID=UPI0024BB3699|nr:biotin--[acetyl-CoA-carboxylase] ligase [Roseomonas sp. E05]MDJ0388129.1 biotin--[acetyl-CoA-carboxylase] ligase [Roseomonas sp. E05]